MLFICAPFHSYIWKQFNTTLAKKADIYKIKAVIGFHSTIGLTKPTYLPNFDSTTVYIITSMDHFNNLSNVTAYEPDDRESVKVRSRYLNGQYLLAPD